MSDQDQSAIISILNLYAIAMDAQRWDLFDSIFTRDVDLEYPGVRWHDLATFKTDFAKAHEGFDATQHAMANHLVDCAGVTATAFSYCFWRLIRKGTVGGDFLEGTAWYDDALVHTPAGWRIKSRTCRILWTDGNPAATGTSHGMPWNALRKEAAEGKINYLRAVDRLKPR
jgi:SnoaL-like domain